eukprot:3473710-Heterocapsa_arctica.AAC.1
MSRVRVFPYPHEEEEGEHESAPENGVIGAPFRVELTADPPQHSGCGGHFAPRGASSPFEALQRHPEAALVEERVR